MTASISLAKWGNSFGVRIPAKILNELGLSINSKLQISAKNDTIIIKKEKSLQDMCDAITSQNLNIDSAWQSEKELGKEW